MNEELPIMKIRQQLGYTRAEVAEKINISRQAVRYIEIGQSQPSVDTAIKLARLYGRTVEELF